MQDNNGEMNVGDENFDESQIDNDQDGFEVGQGEGGNTGDAPTENTTADANKTEPEGTGDVVGDIAERLGGGGRAEDEIDPSAPKANTPMPFDISSLSREQLQSLKAMLNATPEGQERAQKNPQITLRRIDGNYVVDFKNAVLGVVKDPETGRDVERHLIPVKFKGTEEYTNVLYSNFINSDRVACEVLSHKEEKKPIVEGEVFSREKGTIVDMVRTQIISWFTIKLPEGDTLEIEGRLANA